MHHYTMEHYSMFLLLFRYPRQCKAEECVQNWLKGRRGRQKQKGNIRGQNFTSQMLLVMMSCFRPLNGLIRPMVNTI